MDCFMMPLMAFISLGFLVAIAKAALGLGFVIFVHELGHFVVAKLCGVKCEKFYVGFDVPIRIGPFQLPRTLFKKQWGETEYGIGIVPLGGYVKMLGQDDNPANASREAERIRVAREQAESDPSAAEIDETILDPRSYPAKPVFQRFMIISAGVIMNLIFAVIFGMVAYRMGVSYTPTVVGAASPGFSAWEVGLETGDRILQLGREGEPSRNLRFDKDMMIQVAMTGAGQQMDLLVQRYSPPGAEPKAPEWVTVTLSSPLPDYQGRPLIGISQYGTTTLANTDEMFKLLQQWPASQASPPLHHGDIITSVNGVPVQDYTQLTRELARRVDEPLELGIERPAKENDHQEGESGAEPEQLTVAVPTNPVRTLGVQLTMGPITAIQHGSIAEQAGLQLGDQILQIQGEPIGDPMFVPDQLRRLAGSAVSLKVKREGADEPLDVTLTPKEPDMLHIDAGLAPAVPVEALGFAFSVNNVIAHVVPGSAAEAAGLMPGDLLQAAEFVTDSKEDADIEKKFFGKPEPIELGDKSLHWPRVHDRLGEGLTTTKVKLSYQRGDHLKHVTLSAEPADNWYYADRGLRFGTLKEVHQVDSWATAFALGRRETWESMRQVYMILYRLVTGQFSPMNLGGPASIATMAGIEASESTARLLVFLTLLSANLAVVNFLPIPVLDGGHAMFLLYEGIFRRPVNERVAFGLTMVGFCFVLGLMLFVIGLDVWRLAGLAG